ncbi:MAG: gamma-glutamyltransferase, partial [Gammaproteobacteria bacterium]
MRPVIGTSWAIVTGHPLATRAGADILAAGGNAVDAGVAAGLCLAVVHPDMVSLAGVAPILVHEASTGETWEVAGLGPFPSASSIQYFQERHGGQIAMGVARTVVPGAPDAWCAALDRWGTRAFAEVAAPAKAYAAHGFPIGAFSAQVMHVYRDRYRRWPSSAALFLRDGHTLGPGERLALPDLHDTLERMVRAEGRAAGGRRAGLRAARDEFYRGETARRIVAFHEAESGPLTLADLAGYSVDIAPALRGSFGQHEVAVCNVWSQGPAFLQMLGILDGMGRRGLEVGSTRYFHRIIETIKLAFADREAYYGDPRFVEVPLARLLAFDYAEARRALIGERAWAGMPPAGAGSLEREPTAAALGDGSASPLGTSYVGVVDAAGNVFSATPSDPHFDSPIVPG